MMAALRLLHDGCNDASPTQMGFVICSLRGSMPFIEKSKSRNGTVVLIILGTTVTDNKGFVVPSQCVCAVAGSGLKPHV